MARILKPWRFLHCGARASGKTPAGEFQVPRAHRRASRRGEENLEAWVALEDPYSKQVEVFDAERIDDATQVPLLPLSSPLRSKLPQPLVEICLMDADPKSAA